VQDIASLSKDEIRTKFNRSVNEQPGITTVHAEVPTIYLTDLGLAIFDTIRELDTNTTRENKVRVYCNRVWVIIWSNYNRVDPPDTIVIWLCFF
jgi:hypothetical protein